MNGENLKLNSAILRLIKEFSSLEIKKDAMGIATATHKLVDIQKELALTVNSRKLNDCCLPTYFLAAINQFMSLVFLNSTYKKNNKSGNEFMKEMLGVDSERYDDIEERYNDLFESIHDMKVEFERMIKPRHVSKQEDVLH